MTLLAISNCQERGCKHYDNVLALDDVNHVHICKAFPNGIPNEIAFGNNLHTEPYLGQENDIVYEFKAD